MAKILYLDERPEEVGDAVDRMEKEYRFEVDLVTSLEEAVNHLNSIKYDLLIFDLMLYPDRPIVWDKCGLFIIGRVLNNEFIRVGNSSEIIIVVATAVFDGFLEERDGKPKFIKEALAELGIPPDHIIEKPWPSTGEGNLVSLVANLLDRRKK